MKRSLKKINIDYYSYLDKETGMLFELKHSDYGVLAYGKAYYLSLNYNGSKTYIATFCVRDDGYQRYKEAYGKVIWSDMNEIIENANRMMNEILE